MHAVRRKLEIGHKCHVTGGIAPILLENVHIGRSRLRDGSRLHPLTLLVEALRVAARFFGEHFPGEEVHMRSVLGYQHVWTLAEPDIPDHGQFARRYLEDLVSLRCFEVVLVETATTMQQRLRGVKECLRPILGCAQEFDRSPDTGFRVAFRAFFGRRLGDGHGMSVGRAAVDTREQLALAGVSEKYVVSVGRNRIVDVCESAFASPKQLARTAIYEIAFVVDADEHWCGVFGAYILEQRTGGPKRPLIWTGRFGIFVDDARSVC